MAHVDEELALRRMLADLTADQPDAPPARYPAVRRQAAATRRRQLAGAAAAVAILVAAAIAIPLGLLHASQQPPAVPSRYHVSVNPPGPHAPAGLIASGKINAKAWRLEVRTEKGIPGYCMISGRGPSGMNCDSDSPALASRSGAPVSFTSSIGRHDQIDVGTVRSDVTSVQISFSNGQVLTLRTVDVLGLRYAPFIAVAAPYAAAVTEVTAYDQGSELGYAIPFTGAGSISLGRWLRPGQAPLPRPAEWVTGSGTVAGHRWREYVATGPWGTCFAGAGFGSSCGPTLGELISAKTIAGLILGSEDNYGTFFAVGETASSARYLVVTYRHGGTARVAAMAAGTRRFFTYPSPKGDPVVRWAVYGQGGRKLASGSGQYP